MRGQVWKYHVDMLHEIGDTPQILMHVQSILSHSSLPSLNLSVHTRMVLLFYCNPLLPKLINETVKITQETIFLWLK